MERQLGCLSLRRTERRRTIEPDKGVLSRAAFTPRLKGTSGKPIFVTKSVEVGGKKLQFRNDAGFPAWAGRGRRAAAMGPRPPMGRGMGPGGGRGYGRGRGLSYGPPWADPRNR